MWLMPFHHRQYRTVRRQSGSKVGDCAIEVISFTGHEYDIVGAVDALSAYGLDRRPELAVRRLDDEPPFSKLRHPPRPH